MKEIAFLAAVLVASLIFKPVPLRATEEHDYKVAATVGMLFNDEEMVVELFDNPASRNFLSLLPFTGIFEDFARTEKIFYLPRPLKIEGSPTARQAQGGFAYYAPWGNLAIFYDGSGSGESLYVLDSVVKLFSPQ